MRAQCEARSFAYLSTANYNFFPHVAARVGPIATLQRCHVAGFRVGGLQGCHVATLTQHMWVYVAIYGTPGIINFLLTRQTSLRFALNALPVPVPVPEPAPLPTPCLSGPLIAHYLFKALILFTKNVRKISASRHNAFYGLRVCAGEAAFAFALKGVLQQLRVPVGAGTATAAATAATASH